MCLCLGFGASRLHEAEDEWQGAGGVGKELRFEYKMKENFDTKVQNLQNVENLKKFGSNYYYCVYTNA